MTSLGASVTAASFKQISRIKNGFSDLKIHQGTVSLLSPKQTTDQATLRPKTGTFPIAVDTLAKAPTTQTTNEDEAKTSRVADKALGLYKGQN